MNKNTKSNYIHDICNLYNMKQLISEPTRVTRNTASLIDIIMTTMPQKHKDSRVIKVTLSDHFMIYTDICYNIKVKSKEITCRTFKKFDITRFITELSDALINFDYNTNLTQMRESFKNTFSFVSNKHAPVRTYRIKGNSLPWVNQSVVNAMKERNRLYEIAVKEKDNTSYNKYRESRNRVTKLIRDEKQKYFMDRVNNVNKMSSNDLWKSVKMLLGNDNKDCVPNDMTSDGFNCFFTSIGSEINQSFKSDELRWRGPESIYNFKFNTISEVEICHLLQKLPSKSNDDILGFDCKLLNIATHVICKPLYRILNKSLEDGTVLDDWKTARITPIFKGKGKKNEHKNYRPISVIPHIAKLFEKCIHNQLLSYMNQHAFLTVDQSAYLHNHSTQTLLHQINDNWLQNIDDGLITGVCFYDIAKCFDSLSHDVLLFKLQKYGIKCNELQWFTSYFIIVHKQLYVIILFLVMKKLHLVSLRGQF